MERQNRQGGGFQKDLRGRIEGLSRIVCLSTLNNDPALVPAGERAPSNRNGRTCRHETPGGELVK